MSVLANNRNDWRTGNMPIGDAIHLVPFGDEAAHRESCCGCSPIAAGHVLGSDMPILRHRAPATAPDPLTPGLGAALDAFRAGATTGPAVARALGVSLKAGKYRMRELRSRGLVEGEGDRG